MSLDWLIRWLFIAVLAVVAAGWMWAEGIGIEGAPILHRLEFAGIMLVFSALFAYLAMHLPATSRLPFLLMVTVDILLTLLQIGIFLPPAVAISYLAATMDRPLVDALLLRADAFIGFDWASFAAWVAARPVATTLFSWAYFSVIWQAALIIFLQCTREPGDTNGDLIWTLMISAVACALISGFLPALGMEGLAGPEPIAALRDVRDGVWRSMNFDAVQGIVVFPSFHAALGIVLPYSIRRVRWAFWLLVVLNAVMILSTAPVGGHYIVDTIAGCVIALASILLMRLVRGWIQHFSTSLSLRSGSRPAPGVAAPARDA
jgi:hypothetical protein